MVIDKEHHLHRFESHIIDKSNCWITNLCVDKDKYPHFRLDYLTENVNNDPNFRQIYRTTQRANIASYLLYNGYIPDGLMVRHICNNPACVNPNHLILGTAKDNKLDSIKIKSHAHGSTNGMSKLTEDDIIQILIDSYNYKYLNFHQIARQYNCQYQTIANIFLGLNWIHVTEKLTVPLEEIRKRIPGICEKYGKAKLTINDVKYIKSQLSLKSNGELALQFNVDKSTISNIRRGKSWKNV